MADIAGLVHWSPATMEPMPLEELVMWRGKVVKRCGVDED